MNDLNNKILITHLSIGLATTLIIIITTVWQVAGWTGRQEANYSHLSREVDKWDGQVILIHDKISALQYTQ